MSLLKRVLQSFRKFFQYPKKKIKRKTKVRKKPASVKKKAVLKNRSVSSAKVRKSSPKLSSPKSKNSKLPKQKTALKEDAIPGPFIGDITHFFNRIQVAVVELKEGSLKAGDRILIKGKNTHFPQDIKSMQVESVDVKVAKKGQIIGLKVVKEAQVGDKVYKLK